MKRHCSICARGGSKGVKNKNIRLIDGKPLIIYSIEQAIESGLFESISVSSDSPEILAIASRYPQVTLIERPVELATDQAPKIPVIQHCLLESERKKNTKFDTVIDLDATSPLRDVSDIRAVVEMVENGTENENVITGTPARRSPYFNLVELSANEYVRLAKVSPTPIVRRQDAPKCYDMNASIYGWKRQSLLNATRAITESTRLIEMPEDRSIDIDSELDFSIVEMLLKRKTKEKK